MGVRGLSSILFFIAAAAIFVTSQACAQSAPEPLGAWKLEELRTNDGKVYQGVVLEDREYDLDFAEIVQPVGRPMFAVVRWLLKKDVLHLTTLPEKEHRELLARFEQFRNRLVIEAGRMENLLLRSDQVGGKKHHLYDGPWFRVDSTTDEETTRRCVVRIEQIFQAYRMLLPPKGRPPAPLRVRLFGSLDEYRAELRRLKLNIKNPAFYSTSERTILAGSDLNTYAEQLAEIRRDHEAQRTMWQQRDAEFGKLLPGLVAELKAAGRSTEEINDEVRLRRARWKGQLAAKLAEIDELDRRNDGKFAEVTAQMFAQLYHEAFHAWIDNFVYANQRRQVPRWLNEGLAQVFESGKLDGASLRLDAPSPTRLAFLQNDLRRQPWSLAEFLTAENPPFLEGHTRDAQASAERTYAYAWGLAWYLAFHEQKLAAGGLDRYVSAEAGKLDPLARFEKLAGQKLPQFEREWRRAMLEIRR